LSAFVRTFEPSNLRTFFIFLLYKLMLFSYKSISLLQSSLGRKKLREREVKMMTRFETAKCITYKNCPSKCAQCEESKYAHHMPKRYLSFYKIFFSLDTSIRKCFLLSHPVDSSQYHMLTITF